MRGHQANMRFFGGTQMRPDYLVIEPEGPCASEFRDRVETLGLAGKWVQPDNARRTDFQSLPRPKQEEAISALLGEAENRAEYEDPARKDSSVATGAQRLASFARIVDQRAAARSRLAFHIGAQPDEDFHEDFFRATAGTVSFHRSRLG